MLAQLKTVVLIKEAIKLALFRQVENLEHQHLIAKGVSVYTVFLINLMFFNGTKMCFSFKNKDISK